MQWCLIMRKDKQLPISEEIDFHYLLTLMPALHDVPEFCWLPELFCVIGADKLITLCKYAGGENITIPTIAQLSNSISGLQAYYDVCIKHTKSWNDTQEPILSLGRRIEHEIAAHS